VLLYQALRSDEGLGTTEGYYICYNAARGLRYGVRLIFDPAALREDATFVNRPDRHRVHSVSGLLGTLPRSLDERERMEAPDGGTHRVNLPGEEIDRHEFTIVLSTGVPTPVSGSITIRPWKVGSLTEVVA
jgi:hypothetical protein